MHGEMKKAPLPPNPPLRLIPKHLVDQQINRAKDFKKWFEKVVPKHWETSECIDVYVFGLPFWDHLNEEDKYELEDVLHDLLYVFECGYTWEERNDYLDSNGYVSVSPGFYDGIHECTGPDFHFYELACNLYDNHIKLFGREYGSCEGS